MLKNVIKYILIFIIIVSILFSTLVLTSKISRESIVQNLEESAQYYNDKAGIHMKYVTFRYELLHYYADSMLLNIMNFIDEDKPMESIMEARYYKGFSFDNNLDYINSVYKNRESNQQYIRYWHGSLAILRPLMTILNIEQIYNLNNIVFIILFLILTILLMRKYKVLALVFVLASIMITLHVTPNCIEYIWTVFIMMIVSIISILIEKNGNKNLYIIYFITGILTCFFDFLTTETLTILIPIIFVILIRYKENRLINFKEGFKFIVFSGLIWFLSYSLMWFTKWILASIILNVNAFEYVKDNAMLRINWNFEKELTIDTYKKMLLNNIMKIYPLGKVSLRVIIIIIITCILGMKVTNKIVIKQKEKMTNEAFIKILLAIIAIVPYIRYCILTNHSNNHSFFTFRAQLPSIIAIMFIIIYSLDKSIREKIKLPKRKNKNERKRINNINSST